MHLSHIFPRFLTEELTQKSSKKKGKKKGTKAEKDEQLIRQNKRKWCTKTWLLVQKYSQIELVKDKLNGNGIHNLSNVLTLSNDLHSDIDCLDLWLEPDEMTGPQSYKVFVVDPTSHIYGAPTFMTKTSLQLPDSRFLKLHGCIAKAFHKSGYRYMGNANNSSKQEGVDLDVGFKEMAIAE